MKRKRDCIGSLRPIAQGAVVAVIIVPFFRGVWAAGQITAAEGIARQWACGRRRLEIIRSFTAYHLFNSIVGKLSEIFIHSIDSPSAYGFESTRSIVLYEQNGGMTTKTEI